MRYFVPTLALGALSPPQTQSCDKFGGLPWGLPADKWPLCLGCGHPQTHLATFTHSAGRLDLGADGRAVLVFQCGHSPDETDCENYAAGSGANAVVFLDAHELGSGLTEPPAPGTPKQIEMRVTAWEERDDLVTPDLKPAFLNGDSYGWHDEATETTIASVADGAKLGSVPLWIQGGESFDPAFRFAAQLGSAYNLPGPIPSADAAGVTVWHRSKEDGRVEASEPASPDPDLRGGIYAPGVSPLGSVSGYDVDAADFGDLGTGYLFISPDPVTPQGLFLWQCG